MILVVGGIGSGKRSYAKSLGYSDADMSADVLAASLVLVDAQDLMRAEDADAVSLAEQLAHAKRVVLCQEVGSGIVPIEPAERLWRERVGALATELAKRADVVVRMSCGIPQVLKGAEGANVRAAAASVTSSHAAQSFFANRACKYFPCHEGVSEEDFNCLFCYCPLYALGPDCGGNFTYTDSGRKNCKGCALPHVGENGVHMVMAHYEQLAALAGRDNG